MLFRDYFFMFSKAEGIDVDCETSKKLCDDLWIPSKSNPSSKIRRWLTR